MNNWLDDLRWRGLINSITNEEKLNQFINSKEAAAYVGFDPSAASLHLGNYVMIMMVRRLNSYGVKTYALVGGATGMIGDPSGKSSERVLLDEKIVLHNKEAIINQLKKYASQNIIDNFDHFKNMNFLTFLRDVGKYVNVNYLLEKEIIKNRLETSGISYTEFSYNLIQSYDFYKLYNELNVHMQIGGSDQWGNITAGIELIRKINGDNNLAVGMTINLLTNSEGKKFGKSEKGAIFLDKNLTSPYEMYQYLINQSDNDVIRLLKVFTLLTKEEIEIIEQKHLENPSLRIAQSELAKWVVNDIHGQEELNSVIYISDKLFKGDINNLSSQQLKTALNNVPSFELKNKDYNVVDFLFESKIIPSKTQARELVNNKGISINGIKVEDSNLIVNNKMSYDNEFTVVRKGKKNYFIVKWN